MKNKFEMLSLNAENVNRICNDCLTSDSTNFADSLQLYKNNPNHTIHFDSIKVSDYYDTITYLIGQLADIHQNKSEISLKSSIVRYDKKPWTKDMETLIHFYYLGMASDMFSPIDDVTKTIEVTTILPTLSPNDPNFKQWLKTDGKRWEARLGKEPSDN